MWSSSSNIYSEDPGDVRRRSWRRRMKGLFCCLAILALVLRIQVPTRMEPDTTRANNGFITTQIFTPCTGLDWLREGDHNSFWGTQDVCVGG